MLCKYFLTLCSQEIFFRYLSTLGIVFILLIVSFAVQKLSFYVIPLTEVSYLPPPPAITCRPMPRTFFPVFYWEFYCINSYVSVFDPLQDNFCERYNVGIQFHFSASGYAVFPDHLLKGLSFPGQMLLAPL